MGRRGLLDACALLLYCYTYGARAGPVCVCVCVVFGNARQLLVRAGGKTLSTGDAHSEAGLN